MNKPAVLLVTMVLLLIALSGFDSSFSFEKDFPADLNGDVNEGAEPVEVIVMQLKGIGTGGS